MLSGQQGYTGAALALGEGEALDLTSTASVLMVSRRLPYVTLGSGSLTAMAMFEDKFRTDMEEEQAERLVSEATAADALVTWGLEVTLVSLSPARASWMLCTQCPKGSGEAGPAQGREGPLQASVSGPQAWTRRRCNRQPGSSTSWTARAVAATAPGGWGSGGVPCKMLGQRLLRKPSKK